MRAKYYAPIQSLTGDTQGGATVSVFARGTTLGGTQLGTLTTLPLYADASSGTLLTNPFIASSGVVSFYLPLPTRFDLGIQVPGQAQVFFPDVSAGVPSLVPTVITANYTVLLSDQLILASAAGGNITLTLPAATAEFQVVIKRTDSSANTLSIAPPASGQLDNAGTAITLAALAKSRIYCDGTKYWTI